MGAEIFKLKSLYMDDTVVRGARVGLKNARTTKTIVVNSYDDPQIKTGETGINAEYLVQASVKANNLQGYGTFTNNSPIVTGYTGPQDLKHGDLIRLNYESSYYTVTGIQGTNVYITSKYVKSDSSTPAVQTGSCTVRKTKLDSVNFEYVVNETGQNYLYYSKDNVAWGVTGIQLTGPIVAPKDTYQMATGMNLIFQEGTSATAPDIMTVNTVRKTLVDNNTTAISDVSLSPLPYPHDSLKVYFGPNTGTLPLKKEYEDYLVNYSQDPDLRIPMPPYEERTVAYIKFLDRLTDESQISSIDATFEGAISIVKETVQPGGVKLAKQVKNIVPTEDFVIKVKDEAKIVNKDFVADKDAGIVTFIKHLNSESLIDTIMYPKDILWDGISVIRGVGQDDVQDMNNLVIPPLSGIPGTTGLVYYEDTEQNVLVRDVDYIIEPESGAIRLNSPLKDTESVLVSYYVEGEDVKEENVLLTDMRLNKYPLIYSSLTLVQNYTVIENNVPVSRTKVLLEGTDFEVSYFSGKIRLLSLSSDETIISLKASYTPLAPINCILQTVFSDDTKYTMTIVDDILKNTNTDNLIFRVDNPSVSIPKKIQFKSQVTDSNYEFLNTIQKVLAVKEKDSSRVYDVEGYTYDDSTRELRLDTSIQESRLDSDTVVVATYTFESETLPYAPLQVFFPIYEAGQSEFLIEGFDRTDVLKKDMVLRIDNYDPEMTYYFKLQEVSYDGENTRVKIFGSFPEQIIRPTFYLFDDEVQWQSLPENTTLDKTSQVNSETLLLTGDMLIIKRELKTNSLLMIDGQYIHTVNGVSITGNTATVSIFPYLRYPITTSVQYSRLPVYTTNDTLILSKYPALTSIAQPAFTLSYTPPPGFDGGAKIIIDDESIILYESVAGIQNPKPYQFRISNYSSIYDMAKAIQATTSTFPENVPDMQVPNYSPFTIASKDGGENYYLSDGTWSADLIVPFEENTPLDIPYTVNIVPELFHWTLLRTIVNNNFFIVEKRDRRDIFSSGDLLAFKDKIDGQYYYFEVANVELTPNVEDSSLQDSKVNLTDSFRLNMLDCRLFKYPAPDWNVVSNVILDIDLDHSIIVLGESLRTDIKVGSMIKIADKYIYKITDLCCSDGNTMVTVKPSLDERVKAETYYGYIKASKYPVYLEELGSQPYLSIQYSAPKGHVGRAEVEIREDGLTIREVIDNFYQKSTTMDFGDYKDFSELVAAIENLTSQVDGKKPYKAEIVGELGTEVLMDEFKQFRLEITSGYLSLSRDFPVGVSAFEVIYTVPGGYTGKGQIRVESNEILIREVIDNFQGGRDGIKVTRIAYTSTQDLLSLINNVIPDITSLVSDNIRPFSTKVLHTDLFGDGYWGSTFVTPVYASYEDMPQKVYGRVVEAQWQELERLDETRLISDTDYVIENGYVTLTEGIQVRDRYRFNYMGLWDLGEYEGESILCSCQYITDLPAGSRLDVQLDYLNVDQFYLQKCTERTFSEIVVVPQIGDILEATSSGGQSSDNGANNNTIPNYRGGASDLYYLLRDEEIKKQLYVRFWRWYKKRIRNLSAELQLGLGFKFANSTAVGYDEDGQYTLADEYVETADYTLTSDRDLEQITNGNSKFFPVKYQSFEPVFYPRFTDEYLTYNEVFCCNIYWNNNGTWVTQGIVKSEKPYWNRSEDLIFKVWADDYLNPNLVGYYSVDVPEDDRSFKPDTYTFLKTVRVGDSIKVNGRKTYYKIASIESPVDTENKSKGYEYMVLSKPFKEKGIKTYNLKKINAKREEKGRSIIDFNTFVDSLPSDGKRIYIKRQSPEPFPMFDDYSNLGASAYGDSIDGHITDTRRIKKPFGKSLCALLFPLGPEAPKLFKIKVKKDSESIYEDLEDGVIDLSKLTFKEERNVDDVMDALRYDFTQKYTIPGSPIKYIYDIAEDASKGFHRYFYLSFERIYDPDSDDPSGYYQGIVIRAKNREWWFKVVNGTEADTATADSTALLEPSDTTVQDYGFDDSIEYKNFYDPQNIYKRLLLEKQAWETEELVIKDLYDMNDKLARAFDQGDLNNLNSVFQEYLAKPVGGSKDGITDILKVRIPAYEKQLLFLINSAGPVYGTLYPDGVHAENEASPEIAITYQQTLEALNIYQGSYNKMLFYKQLNEDNNITWRNDYVRWVLSLENGLIYQKDAKQMYDQNTRLLTVGFKEIPALLLTLPAGTVFKVEDATVTVSSDYNGKYIKISFSLSGISDPTFVSTGQSITFYLYKTLIVDGITSVVYKTLDEISSEISSYTYSGQRLFLCENVFEHYERNTLKQLVMITNMPIYSDTGATLSVSNVADHRESDPRVLFLNRGIEDRIYTQGIREMPGFSLKYLGSYYAQEDDGSAILITLSPYSSSPDMTVSYGIFLDKDSKKVFVLKVNTDEYIFNLYNPSTKGYITIRNLVNDINYTHISGSTILASMVYNVSPYGNLSSEYLGITSDFISVKSSQLDFVLILYAHVNTDLDNINTDLNQAIYRIYYGDDFRKHLEIKFEKVIKDGNTIKPVNGQTSIVFTYDFQKTDGTYKTLKEFVAEINSSVFRREHLFEAVALYEIDPKEELSCRFVVTENAPKFLGYDQSEIIYVDTYVEKISPDSSSNRDVLNKQNAYFSFPFYTANGNPNKVPIEGIPVAGMWDITSKESVLEIECIDGIEWTVSFQDYSEGDYKNYKPKQEVLKKIDNHEILTKEEYETLGVILDQPVVSILKELVLTRNNADPLRINLRRYPTINELVVAINEARFNAEGAVDPKGIRQFFSAKRIGDPDIQGQYKSYEIDAIYTPIIRDVLHLNDNNEVVSDSNKLVGWDIKSTTLSASDKHILNIGNRRYSPGNTYGFTMASPEKAYNDTLNNNPQGFRRDTLAFNVYCWDNNGRYEIKDNWIYFSSTNLVYDSNADVGQPDKTLGVGIPLAGSGHIQAPDNENMASLMNRINNNGIVRKWFYVNLKFTRRNWLDSTKDIDNPGFFEYGYLPNYSADVPKSQLDSFNLRNDTVMQISPGDGYIFTESLCEVNDTADTLDLSCTWTKTYAYEADYDLSAIGYTTISGLASKINSALAPTFASSVFEARVVTGHASDPSINLVQDSGSISEVSEGFLPSDVDVLNNQIYLDRGDWLVNDVVRFTSSGILPSPLVEDTDYYVVNKQVVGSVVKLKFSLTEGGPVINITSTGTVNHTIIRRYVNFFVSIPSLSSALQVRIRNATGYNFVLSSPTFRIFPNVSRLTLSCSIQYTDAFSASRYDISSINIGDLSEYISNIYHYTDTGFGPLFKARVFHPSLNIREASRLLDYYGIIGQSTYLSARLNDIVAMKILSMVPAGVVNISTLTFTAQGYKTYSRIQPADRDLHTWIDDVIRGDYKQGMIYIELVPFKVEDVPYGLLDKVSNMALSVNTPAPGYFGVMGDINWMQISDHNLHVQLNYIKERLGKPWRDSEGVVQKDYYTPQEYNLNNPYAIDLDNFLGYLRTVRYNQIRESMINEQLVQNKYLWLYMKFHKEIGCDQRVIALRKQIEKQEKSASLLLTMG